MLRVGLTGGLGSGKSTVAAMLRAHGASVMDADEIGRELMRPGQAVYAQIVARFGPGVVRAGGELDRAELARLAFGGGRVEELNEIVHPAVIARQSEITEQIGAIDPLAIVVVESALIFETRHGKPGAGEGSGGPGWRARFDVLVLVTATRETKVERYVARQSGGRVLDESARGALAEDAFGRIERQIADEVKAPQCDYVIRNEGSVRELATEVDGLWDSLLQKAIEGARR